MITENVFGCEIRNRYPLGIESFQKRIILEEIFQKKSNLNNQHPHTMKNIFILLLSLTTLIACKNGKEEPAETLETVVSNDTIPTNDVKFSLAQWSFHLPIQKGLMDPMDFAKRSKDLGFDMIEYVDQLYPKDTTIPYEDWVMNLANEWKIKNDSAGVSFGLIMIDTAGELADPDEKKRQESIKKHKNWIDAAAAVGSPAIRVNLFGFTELEPWHNASVAALKELGAYAAEKNIMILPENHAQLSNNADYMVAVIDEVNMPNVGVLPDFGNFCVLREKGDRWNGPCLEEYDRYEGIAKLMKHAKGFVSAKSQNFDENGDETKIDYYKMMEILKDAGFTGYIGVEYENEEYEDPSEGIMATKNLVIKGLEKAN
ncbi:MAG: xylose isomerase [Flavobacteriaceae bacterium]|nr:xylose isomerase [Flavobacteriaceae bacterium]